MTKTELLELIKNGENSGIEFKRDTIDNRAMAKELVAFANLRGGRVFLGVESGNDVAIVQVDRGWAVHHVWHNNHRTYYSQQTPGMDDTNAWQNLLVNTEFLVEEDDTVPATVAGILLFCANPNRFLPQAGIDAVAYPGKEKDYAAKERLAIRGPMTALFGSEGLVENGLVEQAVEFIRRNTEVSASLADGARREER